MDRDEALKLLKGGWQGIGEWNRRRSEGETIPHLDKTVSVLISDKTVSRTRQCQFLSELRRAAGQSLHKNPNRSTHSRENESAPSYRRFS